LDDCDYGNDNSDRGQKMHQLQERTINCPYCGKAIDVLIDSQDMAQEYIEDCQICCRPITFIISSSTLGETTVSVHSENETF